MSDYVLMLCGLLVGGLAVWLMLRMRHKPPMVGNSQGRVEAAAADSPEKLAVASTSADALIFGDIENPLVEITATDFSGYQVEPINVDSAMRSALEPLLQHAPGVLSIGRGMATKTYRVVFSPAVTRALNRGNLELVPTANKLLPVARDVRNGQFRQIGKTIKEGGFRFANAAAMSYQIAAIVTAQHYLGEINARLAGIERGIDDIRTWLEEEKKGELRAAVHLLREYYKAISRGDLHADERAVIYHQLDAIERTCVGIGELAREMSRRRLEELDRIDVREWTDRGGSAERAIKWVKHNREALDLIFLAQSVRILACQVKSTLPGDRQRLRDRIEHAKTEVLEAQHLFEATREVLDDKVRELRQRTDNFFAMGGVLDEDYRHKINLEFSCAREHTAQGVERLLHESTNALEFSGRFEKLDNTGLTLDVEVSEDGKIEILSAQPTSS
jgi:hypothetical protein